MDILDLSISEDVNKSRRILTPWRTFAGIFLVLLSYLAGWPLIGVLGVVASEMGRPEILNIGGPAVYGASYILFLTGVLLVGGHNRSLPIFSRTARFMRSIGFKR